MLPLGFLFIILQALAQTPEPPSLQLVQPQGQAAPPPVITLQDALDRAKKLDTQYQLAITDTRNYYALVTSQRKYATAQQGLQQAQRFLQITQQQEQSGQVARSDVVKAQIQYEQQRQGFQEAMLGMESARLNLAVLDR